jgi:hypothetical protein
MQAAFKTLNKCDERLASKEGKMYPDSLLQFTLRLTDALRPEPLVVAQKIIQRFHGPEYTYHMAEITRIKHSLIG